MREGVRLARAAAAWMIAVFAVTATLGFAVDVVLLVRSGAGARQALACGVASVALASFVALAVALPAAAVARASRRIARARSWMRFAWPAPVVVVAWLVAVVVTQALLRYRQGTNNVVMLAFAFGLGSIAVLERTPRWWARAALSAILAAGLAIDMALVKSARDLHDLLGILSVCAGVAIVAPLRRRLETASPRAVFLGAGGALALSFVALGSLERAAPGWPVRAWQFDRYQGKLARACRALVDLDIDGFSPVAWGGDCDDLDASRNPFAHERPGEVDANCNGTTPSAEPSDDDRGLSPPAGDPSYAPGDVDLFLLVTIDCGRHDILRPDVMPELTKLAESGKVLSRLYAGGSRTSTSFPLMQRTFGDAPAIMGQLARHGIGSHAVFSWRDDLFTRDFVPTFATVDKPDVHMSRWDATQTTDRALDHLRATKPGTRELLWVHYYDAHDPVVYTANPPVTYPRGPNAPPSYDRYLGAIHHIDAEMGRLFEAARASPGAPRTLIVVTSDHGEGFGHHGVMFHSVSGYEAIIHVPAVMVGPGLVPGRYDGLASHRDLPPTILGAFGLAGEARDAEIFGRSWLRLRDAPDAPLHRFVVSRSARAQRELERLMPMGIIVDANLKYIETFEDSLVGMYDPLKDPREEDDMVSRDAADLSRLQRELALYRDVDRWP